MVAAGARGRVLPQAREWLERALRESGTAHGHAAAQPEALRLEGRAPAFALPRQRWVVRHYRRGGFMERLLGDRYLAERAPRPLRELRVSEAARARGIPTPRVVAALWYPAGPLYRADLVTEWIEGAPDLAAVLFGPADGAERRSVPERRAALAAAGALVSLAAGAGLLHPDLNAKNILLRGPSPAPEPVLIDLDRARLERRGSERPRSPDGDRRSRRRAARMLERLRRSLRRWERASGRPLASEEWRALEQATGARP